MRAAVIGGGIAGITAAHLLSKRMDVCLFEASSRLGGHANPVQLPGLETMLDTGFIIYNEKSYPNFVALMSDWDVQAEIVRSDMSIGFFNRDDGFEYNTESFKGMFPNLKSLLQSQRHQILFDLYSFRKKAIRLLTDDAFDIRMTLLEFLAPFSEVFRTRFALPLASLIWSMPQDLISQMPAKSFLQFLDHHGHFGSPKQKNWRSFKASSSVYLKSFKNQFQGKIHLDAKIAKITTKGPLVSLHSQIDQDLSFDYVVVALHADEAFRLIENPTVLEHKLLNPWRYKSCEAILHTDEKLLSSQQVSWGCWNTTVTGAKALMSYYLNRIHQIDCEKNYFLSLDAKDFINQENILKTFQYQHPIFNHQVLKSQTELPLLNRQTSLNQKIFFCGSYFGYGFHEDAVVAAKQASSEIFRKINTGKE
jgi:predicted NAD/FAD-binding protein